MLKIFKINDPFRLVLILLLLIIFRLPFWISDHGILVPELQWMLVGERMANGHMMYYDIWDYISPLSASVYWILDFLFGRSVVAYNFLALLVAFLQCAIFNTIAQNNKFYSEANYVPGLIYAVLISAFMDFFTLSPMLMGVTFILLALNNIVSQIEFKVKKDEKIASIGLYLGVAALFHFPLILFGPIMFIVLLLFSSTIPRRFILIIYGWVLPFAIAGLYYFISGKLHYLWINHFLPWFIIPSSDILSVRDLGYIMIPVLVFIFLSFLRVSRHPRITNYQSRLIRLMLSFIVLSTLLLFIEIDRFLYVFIVFVPGVSYFISFYFVLSKRKFASEFMFLVFIVMVIGLNWMILLKKDVIPGTSSYYIKTEKQITDSKVVWLGGNIGAYIDSRVATPFLNWKLSERAWNNINQYRYLSLAVRSFIKEKPEIIYDPNGNFKQLLIRAPILKQFYREDGSGKYVLR